MSLHLRTEVHHLQCLQLQVSLVLSHPLMYLQLLVHHQCCQQEILVPQVLSKFHILEKGIRYALEWHLLSHLRQRAARRSGGARAASPAPGARARSRRRGGSARSSAAPGSRRRGTARRRCPAAAGARGPGPGAAPRGAAPRGTCRSAAAAGSGTLRARHAGQRDGGRRPSPRPSLRPCASPRKGPHGPARR